MRGVIKNSGWALGTTAVSTFAVFVETVILAHYLTPSGLGVLLLLIAYPEAVQQLLDFRARDGMTKYLGAFLARDEKESAVAVIKLLWMLDVTISAVALAIVVATAGLVAPLLVDDHASSSLMIIYSVGLFFGSLDTASGAVLRVLDRFGLSFTVGASSSLLRLGAVSVVVAAGGGLEALIWVRAGAELATTLIQGGAGLGALRGVLWEQRGAPISVLRDRYSEIGRFLVNTNLFGVVRLAASKVDTILIGLFASTSAVGLYKIASQLARLPLLAGDALYTVLYPRFAAEYANDQVREVRSVCLRATATVAALVVPLGIVAGLERDQLMSAVGGDAFQPGSTAFAFCLAGVIPYVIVFWAPAVLLAAGHAGALVRLTAIGAGLQVAALVVLVPALEETGAALALALMYLITTGLQLEFIRRRGLLGDRDDASDDRHRAAASTCAG